MTAERREIEEKKDEKEEDMDEEEEEKDEKEEDMDDEAEDKDDEAEENDQKEEDMDEEEENKDDEEEADEPIGGEEVFRSDEKDYTNDEEDIELTKMDAWSQTEEEPVLVQENRLLRKKVEDMRFGFKTIEGNDGRTKFYTGLPSWAVFLHLFLFLAAPASSSCTVPVRRKV